MPTFLCLQALLSISCLLILLEYLLDQHVKKQKKGRKHYLLFYFCSLVLNKVLLELQNWLKMKYFVKFCVLIVCRYMVITCGTELAVCRKQLSGSMIWQWVMSHHFRVMLLWVVLLCVFTVWRIVLKWFTNLKLTSSSWKPTFSTDALFWNRL